VRLTSLVTESNVTMCSVNLLMSSAANAATRALREIKGVKPEKIVCGDDLEELVFARVGKRHRHINVVAESVLGRFVLLHPWTQSYDSLAREPAIWHNTTGPKQPKTAHYEAMPCPQEKKRQGSRDV